MRQESVGLCGGGLWSLGATVQAGRASPRLRTLDPRHGTPGGGRVGLRAWTRGTTSSFLCDAEVLVAPLRASASLFWNLISQQDRVSTGHRAGAESVGLDGTAEAVERRGRPVQNILSAVPGLFENRKPALEGAPSSAS